MVSFARFVESCGSDGVSFGSGRISPSNEARSLEFAGQQLELGVFPQRASLAWLADVLQLRVS